MTKKRHAVQNAQGIFEVGTVAGMYQIDNLRTDMTREIALGLREWYDAITAASVTNVAVFADNDLSHIEACIGGKGE